MTIRRYIAITFVSLVLFGGSVQARAATVDAAGAAHLKTMFEGMLQKRNAENSGEHAQVKLDGAVMVEPADSYYAVTLPRISAVSTDGDRLDIGIIALNVMPTDDPQQWKMTMALPSPITAYGPKNEQLMSLAVGQQYFAGVWHEKFEGFVKLKAQYKNVTLRAQDGSVDVAIPDISADYDLSENGQHRWSGPMRISMAGLHAAMADGGKADIGTVVAAVTLFDYSPDDAAAYRESMNALQESYKAGEDSASVQHISGLYNMVTGLIGKVWDGFKTDVGAENILLTRPPIPGSPAGELRLAKAGFGFDMTGFRANSVTMRLALNYDGFSLKPVTPEFNPATPTRLNVDISISKLPFADIAALGKTSLEGAVQAPPEMAKLVGLQALLSLPQIFTKAGTTLDIRNTEAAGADYSMILNGSLLADVSALQGATGKAHMEVAGLENIVAMMDGKMKKTDTPPEEKEKLQEALSRMAVLQMAGQQGKDASGRPVRLYDFELNKEGKILLNGADMSALMAETPAK